MSVPGDEVPAMNQDQLKQVLTEKEALLASAIDRLKEAQHNLLQTMKGRTEVERRMSELPTSERHGDENRRNQDLLMRFKIIETRMVREEARASVNKYNAYVDFVDARTAATAVNQRLWIPPPQGFNKRFVASGYDEDVLKQNMEDRKTYKRVLDATNHGQQLQESARKKETKLEQAEKIYREIRQKIEQHLRDGVSGASMDGILQNFQKLRETLDERAEDYVATKEKALEAYKLAERFKKQLKDAEQKSRLQQELKLMIPTGVPSQPTRIAPRPTGNQQAGPSRPTGIPKLAVKATGVKPEEVRIKRIIEESLEKIKMKSRKVQLIQQQRDAILREQDSESKRESLDAKEEQLKLAAEKRVKFVEAMKSKLEEILKNRQRYSKDFLKFVQEKLILLKRPMGSFQTTKIPVKRISRRVPSVVAHNHVVVPVTRQQTAPQNEDEFIEKLNAAINELIGTPENSPQIDEVKTRCNEIFDDFYNALKSRHLKTTKCIDILGKTSESKRKLEIVKQLKTVLNNFSREIVK